MSYLQIAPVEETEADFKSDLCSARSDAAALIENLLVELGALPRQDNFHCEQLDELKDDFGRRVANACPDVCKQAAAISKTQT